MGRKARRQQREIADKQMDATDEQLKVYKAEQKIQRKLLAEQKQEYRSFEFKNPYENLENYYEDLTVNTQAADYQKGMVQQQQANIMQNLKGSAGSSGIAGLAQAMANQGAMQAQQISIGIGQQEQQNQMMALKGASAADMAERGGDAMVQSAEMQRQSTMLGIEYGGMAGANAGVQGAYGNQMAGFGMQAGMANASLAATAGMVSAGLNAAGSAMSPTSDRKLKKNINKIGESPSGLNIYSFKYKDTKHGEGLFQGVMSDEVPQEAVGTRDGHDTVDYSMLDVEFKQI
tara:strand:- start:57 stop:923 length:867 start_codon:yes stop_codon:yes gene_type:complete